MEAKLAFKFLVILPLILFVDYLILVLLGCTGCIFGAGDNFTCGIYCIIGKITFALSGLFFLYLIFHDLKKIYQERKNGKTGKEQESL
jgi:hypothetical protein